MRLLFLRGLSSGRQPGKGRVAAARIAVASGLLLVAEAPAQKMAAGIVVGRGGSSNPDWPCQASTQPPLHPWGAAPRRCSAPQSGRYTPFIRLL